VNPIKRKSYFLILIIFSFLKLNGFAQEFERGMEAYANNDPFLALSIWESALAKGDKNPELGFHYIELTTHLGLDSLYSKAEEMYYAVLTDNTVLNYKESVYQELQRLKPIIENALYKKWVNNLEDGRTAFLAEIRAFWEQENTFISTQYNERLIEHWKRIAYARREFVINSKSGFGTDDRGIMYVKLGEPTFKKNGSVSLSGYHDPTTGSTIPLSNNVYFEYELWYYGERSYVFGFPGTGGPFGLQTGMLDLIPIAGNRPAFYYDTNAGTMQLSDQKLRAGSNSSGEGPPNNQQAQSIFSSPTVKQISRGAATLMLQYAVLEEIASVDPFYMEMHNEMTQDLIRQNVNGSSNLYNSVASSQNIKYEAKEANWAKIKEIQTPRLLSDTKPLLRSHDVNLHVFSLLDEKLQSENLIITEITDFNNVQIYLSGNSTDVLRPVHQIDHFITFDENWEKVDEDIFSTSIYSSEYSPYKSYVKSTNTYQTIFQSSFIDSSGSILSLQSGKTPYLISGSKTKYLEQDSSMEEDLNQIGFTVSDVILASVQPENENTRIPFFPNLYNQFEAEHDMIIYFETYGIPRGATFSVRNENLVGENAIEVIFTSEGTHNKVWFSFHLNHEMIDHGINERELLIVYRGKSVRKKISFTVK